MMHERTIRDSRFTKKLVIGLLFMAFGAAFLLHNMGILESDQILCYAPLALVALGLERILSRGFLRATGGHILVILGVVLTLGFLEKEYLIEKWWPLAIVWVGLILTLRALWPAPKPQPSCDNDTFCQDSNERPS
jgi:hypothetical protein